MVESIAREYRWELDLVEVGMHSMVWELRYRYCVLAVRRLVIVSDIVLLNGGENTKQTMLKIVHNLFLVCAVCLYFQVNLGYFTIYGVVDSPSEKINFILKASYFLIILIYKNIRQANKFGVERLSFEFDLSVNLAFMFYEQCTKVGCENLSSDLRREGHNTSLVREEHPI